MNHHTSLKYTEDHEEQDQEQDVKDMNLESSTVYKYRSFMEGFEEDTVMQEDYLTTTTTSSSISSSSTYTSSKRLVRRSSRSLLSLSSSQLARSLVARLAGSQVRAHQVASQARRLAMGTRVLGAGAGAGGRRIVCLCLPAQEVAGVAVCGGLQGAQVEEVGGTSCRLARGDILMAVNGHSLAGVGEKEVQGLLQGTPAGEKVVQGILQGTAAGEQVVQGILQGTGDGRKEVQGIRAQVERMEAKGELLNLIVSRAPCRGSRRVHLTPAAL